MIKKMIIPAILSADENITISQVKQFDGFVDVVQLDVADGQFVTSVTCRPTVLKDVLQKTDLEIHLMVANPLAWLDECVLVRAKRVYLHVETNITIDIIKSFSEKNIEVFLALNPETPIDAFVPYKDIVSGCLFLGVHPGKQGQEFIQAVFEKIISFKEMFADKIVVIDGGVNENNIKPLIAAGVDWLVCGSKIVNNDNPVEAYKQFTELL